MRKYNFGYHNPEDRDSQTENEDLEEGEFRFDSDYDWEDEYTDENEL